MFDWLFGSKKKRETEEKVDKLEDQIKGSFDKVKKDLNNTGEWVKHLDNKDSDQDSQISYLEDELEGIKKNLEGLKNTISMLNKQVFKQAFKTGKQAPDKQTAVEAVQTPVQTGVQTGEIEDLSCFTVMERALLFVLLNTDMKLSYEDLAAMLGKSRATVRGQINSIKRKSESLIKEKIEKNGTKRVHIPEEIKQKLLKRVKVRVNNKKNKEEQEKDGEGE